MTHRLELMRQIRELPYEDVQQHPQIIREEVFLRPWRREKEIQHLEDEQLHTQILRRVLYTPHQLVPHRYTTHSPARLSMKMTFSPNVLLLPNLRIRTVKTRLFCLASSEWSWLNAIEPVRARW